jgi:hypothetical protein
MAGIQAVIDAALSVLGPLVNAKLVLDTLKIQIGGLKADLEAAIAPLDANVALLGPILFEFTAHFAGPGVFLFAGNAVYSDFTSALGPPPVGLTPTTAVNAVVMLVDASSASTWADLQYVVRTTP